MSAMGAEWAPYIIIDVLWQQMKNNGVLQHQVY